MYEVRITRDETGAWIASVPGVPGCHTYGQSLRAAKRRIREALSLWVDDAADGELRFQIDLPASVRAEIDRLTEARQRADDAAGHAALVSRRTVRRLLKQSGLSMRDVAELVGLSHQRVQQLLSGRASSSASDPKRFVEEAATETRAEVPEAMDRLARPSADPTSGVDALRQLRERG